MHDLTVGEFNVAQCSRMVNSKFLRFWHFLPWWHYLTMIKSKDPLCSLCSEDWSAWYLFSFISPWWVQPSLDTNESYKCG